MEKFVHLLLIEFDVHFQESNSYQLFVGDITNPPGKITFYQLFMRL